MNQELVEKRERFNQEQTNSIIDSALKNASQVSDKDLFRNMGAALASLGLEPGKGRFSDIVKPVEGIDFTNQPVQSMYILRGVQTEEFSSAEVMNGERFWELIKGHIKSELCSNEGLITFIEQDNEREALNLIVLDLMDALALSSLWIPPVIAIVTYCVYLIVKTGMRTVCDITNTPKVA